MIAINKLQIFKFNKDKSPFIVFCIFFIIPTLMSLFAWMIFNARGIGDGSGNSFMLLFDSKHLFTDWLIAKAWSTVRNLWEYIGSALSLVISNPSADYHLLRVIPFIYLALHLALNHKNDKDKISEVILFLNVSSGAVLISYVKLWDIFRFIDVADMAVPLKAISLIIWASTTFYAYFSWHRNKLNLSEI